MSFELLLPDDQLRQRFFSLQTPEDVAKLLDVSYPLLEYWLFIAHPDKKYNTFTLSKASGGFRTIYAPTPNLKIIQQKLNQVLATVYESKKPVHGFVSGKSIVTNAQVHAGQTFVFNLDLQDFFPAINFGRVRGMFMAQPYNLPDSVATVLAQICCHKNELPQGAPTSPVISNMICGQLDDQLFSLAKREKCLYTRYADDITFSTSRVIFPQKIAWSKYNSLTEKTTWRPGSEVRRIIKSNGFNINPEKSRMQIINQHQEVTGLTVNEFPNVKRRYVRQIRAMLHAWDKYGLARAEREYYDRYNQQQRGPYKSKPSFKQIVKGKIEFLGMVRGRDNPIYLRYKTWFARLTAYPDAPSQAPRSTSTTDSSQRFVFKYWLDDVPFPLASILWRYNANDNPKEKYEHLLHFFEALAQFMATILLSGFYEHEEVMSKLRTLLEKPGLDLERSSFGTWRAIFDNLSAHMRKMLKNDKGRKACYQLFRTKKMTVLNMLCATELVHVFTETNKLRNKWTGHGGTVSQAAAHSRLLELEKHLQKITNAFAEIWTDFQLISPVNSSYHAGYHDFRVNLLMGSRTPFSKEQHRFEHPLDRARLYFSDPDEQQALELLPFVKILPSPATEPNGCYFYNRQESQGRIRFVSYHFEAEAEITDEFQDIAGIIASFLR
jgi:RNA-directed DNA polymerase